VRTVRSVARARNQPRGHLALIVAAVLALLAVLVARANAAPPDDEDDDRPGAPSELPADYGIDPDRPYPQRRLSVPITSDMIERIVTFAPPVGSVVAAAYRAGGVADDPTPGWRRRSRLAALVPMVSVRAGQNQAWRDVDDPTISHGVAFDVRASWRLDQLLFDRDEPRIAMLDVARRRERRRLAAHAIHLYYDWVAARVAANQDLRAELDAQEKAAELDALTAGWFSQTLAKRAELR
jgi:hypothetical protein